MNASKDTQLDMFENVLIEPGSASRIVWSYSRRQLLGQCPRRYYYQYYTWPASKAKGTGPQKETLKFLKTLSNRYMWAGTIVHSSIRQYLLGLQKNAPQDLETLLHRAKANYNIGPIISLESRHGSQNRGLLELYYKYADAEQLLAECEKRLLEALNNFVTKPAFKPFIQGGIQAQAKIEKLFKLQTNHFSAMGKIDLVYTQDSRVVIVDWKLGGPGSVDENLQLLLYALWGTQTYRCSPMEISVYASHLCDNLLTEIPISEDTLRRTSVRILQDLEKMRMLDTYGQNAVEDAFYQCSSPLICALCPFQAICLKELSL